MVRKTKLLLPHRKGKLLLFLLLSLGMVAFIFTRSLQPGRRRRRKADFSSGCFNCWGWEEPTPACWNTWCGKPPTLWSTPVWAGAGLLLADGAAAPWNGRTVGRDYGGGGSNGGRNHSALGAGTHRTALRCAAGHRRSGHRLGFGAAGPVALEPAWAETKCQKKRSAAALRLLRL